MDTSIPIPITDTVHPQYRRRSYSYPTPPDIKDQRLLDFFKFKKSKNQSK